MVAVAYLALPCLVVLGVAREAVDEELLGGRALHGLAEKCDRDMRGHYLPVLNHIADELPVLGVRERRRGTDETVTHLGAAVHLQAQQVTRREVHIAKCLHEGSALRALARSRPAQHKDDKEALIG